MPLALVNVIPKLSSIQGVEKTPLCPTGMACVYREGKRRLTWTVIFLLHLCPFLPPQEPKKSSLLILCLEREQGSRCHRHRLSAYTVFWAPPCLEALVFGETSFLEKTDCTQRVLYDDKPQVALSSTSVVNVLVDKAIPGASWRRELQKWEEVFIVKKSKFFCGY